MRPDRTTTVTLGCVLGAAALLAALNLLTPAASAVHVPDFAISLVGKYLCYAILALAVDLVWGYAGILTLGHAAFFALGGYAMGMYLMREIGARGVYADPTLPDFMVFIGWKQLPWYWYGFDHFWFALAMVMLVPGVLAVVFGWFAFRSRVSGVYFSIITQALTYALMLAFFRNDMGFGGNNGMTDFKDILGFPLNRESTSVGLMLVTAAVLSAAFLLARAMTRSRFGKVLVAVRDAEARTRFLGYRPESYKLTVWVVSAVIAGIGGALYVPQVGIINPSEFAPGNSIEAVIWVAVGGRGTLGRRNPRRDPRKSRQDLANERAARNLAVCVLAGCSSRHVVSAARHHRSVRCAPARRDARTPMATASRPPPRRLRARSPDERADALLYLDGVTVSFDGFKALNALSLVLEAGEMRAVIGPNGAGKTTMMDVITGKTKPDCGRAMFGADTDLTRLDEPAIARLGIGRKFQRPTVFEPLSVRDNLLLALAGDRSSPLSCSGRAKRRPSAAGSRRCLQTIRLGADRDRRAGELSHGQKQWLEIGMLLAQEPRLLLVDEPVAGMTDAETADDRRSAARNQPHAAA